MLSKPANSPRIEDFPKARQGYRQNALFSLVGGVRGWPAPRAFGKYLRHSRRHYRSFPLKLDCVESLHAGNSPSPVPQALKSRGRYRVPFTGTEPRAVGAAFVSPALQRWVGANNHSTGVP